MDYTLTLPGGEVLAGQSPVVVIGPNGSGKTRQTRQITSPAQLEYINALRNTRVAPELPAVGVDTARNNFRSQRDQSRGNHWELANEFDYMLSQLLAQQSMGAMEFMRQYRENPSEIAPPPETPLTRVEELWGRVFPGRELRWNDWKPLIVSHTTGAEAQYSGNQMSDGEKAALYLAGRVFSADACVLIVDEPETHFHSQLAVRLWNALEDERPDIRFVYVTHDLTFGMSRRNAQFVLASPTQGLRTLDLSDSLPHDVASDLLGSASLSFYASRVVFCEGDATSYDYRLYTAWFNGADTVVRPVDNCARVLRCVDAIANADIAAALEPVGIIDGDVHPQAFKDSLTQRVHVLPVHEVESLFCLAGVVSAVCAHISQSFDEDAYRKALAATVSVDQRHQLIIERWKRRIEPHLEGLVANVRERRQPVEDLIVDLPAIFDHTSWAFSPEALLIEEKERVEAHLPGGATDRILELVPGKQLLPVAARHAGMAVDSFIKLVIDALAGADPELKALGVTLEAALQPVLPARFVAVRAASPAP